MNETCVHLEGPKGMCHKSGCSFKGEEALCPKYEPPGRLKVVYLPIGLIDHHPDNPRRKIGDVTELAESIRAEGIQQPLTVIPHVDGVPERYTAVIGHRRLEAAKKAGLLQVPAFVRQMDRREQLRTMLTENGQREDLTPLEEADGFQQLMMELPDGSAAAVARETGFSETTVRRRMKLLDLPREAVERAEAAGVTMADYEELNRIKDPERRAEAAQLLGTEGFRGRVSYHVAREQELADIERLVKRLLSKGAVEISEEERIRRSAQLSNEQTVYSWIAKNASVIPLARDQEWLFTVNRRDRELRVYRVLKEEASAAVQQEEKSDVDLAREQLKTRQELLREDLAALKMEQEALDQEFLDRREEFVGDFSTFQRYREEIMEMAVMALIRARYWSASDLEELGNWLGLENVKDGEALARCIRANPEKALLYTVYCTLERQASGWHTTTYYLGYAYRMYQLNPEQELLYDCLRLIGYQAGGDELLVRGGAHTLYQQAEKLINQFKADKRELEKRINA